MKNLKRFSIPIFTLKNEKVNFIFEIDGSFFQEFDSPFIKKAQFKVNLEVEKRPELISINFSYSGKVNTPCDRCLDEFDLPVIGENQLLIKYDEEVREEVDIIFIPKGQQRVNVAKFIYEFISLSLPIIKTHDLADLECNAEMLKYQQRNNDSDSAGNSVWDELKKLDLSNK